MTDKQPEAYAVPLHELLVKVPRNQRLEIEFNEGRGTSYIPVGRYCHEAAAELRRLHQSEREAWRYADELEQERKRLHEVNAELVEALQAVIRGVPDTWEGVVKAKAALAKSQGDNNG